MKYLMTGLITASLLLTGCSGMGVDKQTVGAGVGGIIGGVAGSHVGGGRGNTAAIIAGTLAGAMMGGAIGKSMDATDRLNAQQALESSPSGQPISWRNPDSNAQYIVTPTSTHYRSDGSPCREYSTTAIIDGRKETVYGTACRQPDGTWQASS
jgi:surface antigen